MPFFDEGFGLSESLATGSASNVFRPSLSSKRTSKTHGKPRAANRLRFPGIARREEQAAHGLRIATSNAPLLKTGEDKPKSRRQLRKDRKENEWREKQALRNAERQKKGHTKARYNDESRKPEAPKQEVDEEVEFLRRKRQREREAVGSGAGHQANGKKRRKTETKDRGEAMKPNDAFPLLNGEKVPKVLAPAERTGPNPLDLIPHGKGRTSLQEQRQQLPIWPYREALRQCLRDRDVLVMLGQTGSGKSTQIGQFLIDESWMERQRQRVGPKVVALGGCIAITQPRRVAAINLAKRVAQEMNSRLGEDVGYSVRFDNATSGKTRIRFLTDGMLLQEMLADPLLKRYSCIVVDEAHERTVGTDLVMGFLRKLVYGERRGNLKVVVMSATIQMDAMARFFEQNRGEGLLPPEAAIDTPMDASEEKNKEQSNQIQGNVTLPDEGKNGQQPQLCGGDTGDIKKSKKKKKNHRKNIHYNPEDLIRTPSPVPQRIPTPEVEQNGGAVIYTEKETRVIPYFGSVALFEVPGRQFPVEIHHTAAPVEDFIDAALRSVFQIHYAEPLPGDILVFLTGQEEIESLQKLIEEAAKEMKDVPQIKVLPLYAALPLHLQSKIFEPVAARNTRKVILSTNIAETSVTVPGVRHVVDCGKAKLKQFRPKLGLESLLITPISKSSAMQRAGRAGREALGKCFRLYTEADFNTLKESTKPEILRTDIAHAILTLKARGQDDVVNFDYLSRPRIESLHRALEELFSLGAFDTNGKITSLGQQMAKLPLTPPLARVLIAAVEPGLDCIAEVIDVIAALSTDNLFPMPSNDEAREKMGEARKSFRRSEGDHIMLLEVIRSYESEASDSERWCETHLISHRAMKNLFKVREQLRQYCKGLISVSSDTWETSKGEAVSPDLAQRVLKAFLKGYFHQTARATPDGRYTTVLGHQNVAIHPASILFGQKREAIVYYEYVFTTKPFARWCSAVQMDWIADASPEYMKGSV